MDIRIRYGRGDCLAYLWPLSREGRNWISDNVKGTRINSTAVLRSDELLAVLDAMVAAKLAVHWLDTTEPL